MATITLRPTGTDQQSTWTVGGGAPSPHAALADDNDATYIQAAPGGWLCVLDFDTPVIPDLARVQSVSVRVRRRGNSLARLDVAVGYPPPSGSYRSVVLSSGERPTSTIATRTYGSLVQAPGGTPWDNTVILPRMQVAVSAADTNIRVYAVYVDIAYDPAPEAVITSPVGLVRGSQLPTVTFAYIDPDGGTLERVQARLFDAAVAHAVGFTPATAPALWDSGEVLTSSPSLMIDQPVAAGDYVLALRVADAGSGGRYGPWATSAFTLGGQLPVTPATAVSVNEDLHRTEITVTQRDNYLSYGQSIVRDGWHPAGNASLAPLPVRPPSPTATLTETFTGPAGAVGPSNTDIDWTVDSGSFSVTAGGTLTCTTGLGGATTPPPTLRSVTQITDADQYAQVTITSLPADAYRAAHVWLRMAGAARGYMIQLVSDVFGAGPAWIIERWDGPGNKTYMSGYRKLPRPLAAPVTLRAEASGNRISIHVQMPGDPAPVKLGEFTDDAYTGGGSVGVGIYNGGGVVTVDNVEAGSLAAVVAPPLGVTDPQGDYVGEVTIPDARPGVITTGGRYGWAAAVTPGETVTIRAAAWQTSDDARTVRLDAEYLDADGEPLASAVVSDDWAGVPGAGWNPSLWSTFGGGTAEIGPSGGGVLTATAGALASVRGYASGMASMADQEVLVRITPSVAGSDLRVCVGVRVPTASDFHFSGRPAGTCLYVEFETDTEVLVRRGVDQAVLATDPAPGLMTTSGWWLRLRLVGQLVCARWWPADTDEPAAWSWVGTDTTSTSGRVALVAINAADTTIRAVRFDHLRVDDLAHLDVGPTWTTRTDGALADHRRTVTVPDGAAGMCLAAWMFPSGAGETFVWSAAGILPGPDRPWSRGGLATLNTLGEDAAAFATGTGGWTVSANGALARVAEPASLTGFALTATWSTGPQDVIFASSPGRHATAGQWWAVRARLWRTGVGDVCHLGLEWRDRSGAVIGRSFGAAVAPPVGGGSAQATHAARAPDGTATAHAVWAVAASDTGIGHWSQVQLVAAQSAPVFFQPGPSAAGFARAEYLDLRTGTWQLVRGTEQAFYGPARSVLLYDYEVEQDGPGRAYRVSTAAVDLDLDADGGAVVASLPRDLAAVSLPATGWWLRDPLVPARLIRLHIPADLETTSEEPQQVHWPLGRRTPVVVSDGTKSERFRLPLLFTSHADWARFEELRATARPLLLSAPYGDNWFVKLGPTRRAQLLRSSDQPARPVRLVEIEAVEVDRPDPAEHAADTVTDIVWEII